MGVRIIKKLNNKTWSLRKNCSKIVWLCNRKLNRLHLSWRSERIKRKKEKFITFKWWGCISFWNWKIKTIFTNFSIKKLTFGSSSWSLNYHFNRRNRLWKNYLNSSISSWNWVFQIRKNWLHITKKSCCNVCRSKGSLRNESEIRTWSRIFN